MKKYILLLAICLNLSLISCGDKKANTLQKTTTEEIIETPTEEAVFKIKLNAVILNDDEFEIYYQDYNNKGYSYKTRVTKKVTGSPQAQDVEIVLPKNTFPLSLRFDLGLNKSEENIVLNSVEMTYEDFNMKLNSQEFHSFFVPNGYIKYNKETGVIERKVVDGKYDPYFNSRALFQKKLGLEER